MIDLRKVRLSIDEVETKYNQGFVFTRKKTLQKVTSVRINLDKFALTSENRRVLKKVDNLNLVKLNLPIVNNNSLWKIIKVAKDFYSKKFVNVRFSANKIRELITKKQDFPYFNKLFCYVLEKDLKILETNDISEINFNKVLGATIVFESINIIHYAYPFYKIDFDKLSSGAKLNDCTILPNFGMAMMLKAILLAKKEGKHYIYLGSLTRPSDRYKLQFKGVEVI